MLYLYRNHLLVHTDVVLLDGGQAFHGETDVIEILDGLVQQLELVGHVLGHLVHLLLGEPLQLQPVRLLPLVQLLLDGSLQRLWHLKQNRGEERVMSPCCNPSRARLYQETCSGAKYSGYISRLMPPGTADM